LHVKGSDRRQEKTAELLRFTRYYWVIKLSSTGWGKHAARMGGEIFKQNFVGKPEGRDHLGDRRGREDNVIMDLR
jgi:hypothetical protein